MKKSKQKNPRAGFTLVEVIAVLVVTALLAAATIPSMINFINHGHQTNRMNVARSLYVAMQGQLSRAVAEGNLRLVLTEGFYTQDGEGNEQLVTTNRVYNYLGTLNFPTEDLGIGNEENVFFISKPAAPLFTPGASTNNPIVEKFYQLLDEIIINKEILDGAILMEFNVKTGIVMSIFYGDNHGGQTEFGYGAAGNNNIDGGRGMDGGYEHAYQRDQGYYGVTFTGEIPPPPIDDIVNIFDGIDYDDGLGMGVGLNVGPGDSNRKQNILFAEFLLQRPLSPLDMRTLEIYDNDPGGALVLSFTESIEYPTENNFYGALVQAQNKILSPPHAVYYDGEITIDQSGVGVNFHRYIWILDFIEGYIFNQPHSLGTKYGTGGTGDITGPINVRARVTTPEGAVISSDMFVNTHFANRRRADTYGVRSVRHLNNIRYAPNANFIQTENINVRTLINEGAAPANQVYNFRPIETFSGRYDASDGSNPHKRIENLRIDTSLQSIFLNSVYGNVGLFSRINGGSIIGVSLINATINATNATNVGAITGEMIGNSTISRSNAFANVFGGNANTSSTGGLVGRIEPDGTLSHSFNAGFYNTHPPTGVEGRFGSVTAQAGNIGGLVGTNRGTIQLCFNNARVNIDPDDINIGDSPYFISRNPKSIPLLPGATAHLGGIAGGNTGRISSSYATNHVAVYPETNVFSGGIAGRNDEPGMISDNSVFIDHSEIPCIGNEITPLHRGVSKRELMATGSPSFRPLLPYPQNWERYNNNSIVPKNIYDNYPYPLLSNNMPFMNTVGLSWGWEDIEYIEKKEADTEVMLLYFEQYDNNNGVYGFWYPDPPEEHPVISGLNPLLHDRPVYEAGYMLIGTDDALDNLHVYVRPGTVSDTNVWASGELLGGWVSEPPPERIGLTEQDRENLWIIRLNRGMVSVLEHRLAGGGGGDIDMRHVPLRIVCTHGTIAGFNLQNIPENVEILESQYFHPFFARAIFGTSETNVNEDGTRTYRIRTPWQMQNIDKVDTGTPSTPGIGNIVTRPPDSEGGDRYVDTGVIGGVRDDDRDIFFDGIPIAFEIPDIDVRDRVTDIQREAARGTNVLVINQNNIRTGARLSWNENNMTVTVSGGIESGTGWSARYRIHGLGNGRVNIHTTEQETLFREAVLIDCLYITGSNTVLTGDFTGINIYNNNDWGTHFGSGNHAFIVKNSAGSPSYIYSQQQIRLFISSGTVLEYVDFGAQSDIWIASRTDTGYVSMNARFYNRQTRIQDNQRPNEHAWVTNGYTFVGGITSSQWNADMLPQFIAHEAGISLTIQGSARMGGIFYCGNNGTAITLHGVTEFHGLFYSNNNSRPNINSNSNVVIRAPELPRELLDPGIVEYLEDRGWEFPPKPDPDDPDNGSGGTPGTEWSPGVPKLRFRQDRNISIANDRGAGAGDGTTATVTKAVVARQFNGIYDGRRNFVEDLTILTITNPPGVEKYGLFAENSGTIERLYLRNSNITGGAIVGGIAAENSGTIERCQVHNVNITGSSDVGGVAGINSGNILQTAVEFSTVRSNNSSVNSIGGIAGRNTEQIAEVYFLSTAGSPVANNGGGIVGRNIGRIISQAYFFAPAPRADNTFFPIVRTGNSADTETYFSLINQPDITIARGGHGLTEQERDIALAEMRSLWFPP